MPSFSLNKIILFITGGSILSLELISSRILNPYFGVSLYIWSGILSITLMALSLGYRRGGEMSEVKELDSKSKLSKLQYKFLVLPAESSVALAITTSLYPIFFFDLARINLVLGSFIASAFLLLVPLVSMSAMNPLLVAINSIKDDDVKAGRSSGDVFFLSTVGSVVGVVVTAFIFIPNMDNHSTVLFIGICLSLITLIAGLISEDIVSQMKKKLIIISSIGLVMCSVLLFSSSLYLKKNEAVQFGDNLWKIEKEYNSMFGNIKVVSVDNKETIYFQGGQRQSIIDEKGNSLGLYNYIFESFVMGAEPKVDHALVLGLAGGLIPMNLAYRGLDVDVVEIVPEALQVANEFFNYDESIVNTYLTDARTFVADCSKKYNTVLVDTFRGSAVPEYLVTREFYRDIKSCLTVDGFVLFNTVIPSRDYFDEYYHILKTLNSEFKNIDIYFDEKTIDRSFFTIYILASNGTKPTFRFDIDNAPESLREKMETVLKSPKPINKDMLRKAKVLTDENNYYSFLSADINLAFHEVTVLSSPPIFLVN